MYCNYADGVDDHDEYNVGPVVEDVPRVVSEWLSHPEEADR